MKRRELIQNIGLASAGLLISNIVFACGGSTHKDAKGKGKTILVVSGWQDVNIGDIAHTPGLLHILETFLPDAKIILWKRSSGEEVKKLLNKNFPKVQILYGGVNSEKDAENPEILKAFEDADLMIHGSGPLLVGADNLACG